MYDEIIYIRNKDAKEGLAIAQSSKQEFEEGDAIESKGGVFITKVQKYMDAITLEHEFSVRQVVRDQRTIENIHEEIWNLIQTVISKQNFKKSLNLS